MNVYEIVEKYLTDNNYDGLFNVDGGCACSVDALSPCCAISGICQAGYKVKCRCGDRCDYDITIEKEVKNEN